MRRIYLSRHSTDCEPEEYCTENGCITSFPMCEPCDYLDFATGVNGGICAVVDVEYEFLVNGF